MSARELRHHAAMWAINASALKNCHDELAKTNPPIAMLQKALRAAQLALDVANQLDEWATHEEQTG